MYFDSFLLLSFSSDCQAGIPGGKSEVIRMISQTSAHAYDFDYRRNIFDPKYGLPAHSFSCWHTKIWELLKNG